MSNLTVFDSRGPDKYLEELKVKEVPKYLFLRRVFGKEDIILRKVKGNKSR